MFDKITQRVITPEDLAQDERSLERLAEDIGKIYRTISDLPNVSAYSELHAACYRAEFCGHGIQLEKIMERLSGLSITCNRALRGLLEMRGESPSKRRLKRVHPRDCGPGWWGKHPEPDPFRFTDEEIQQLRHRLDRFPASQVQAFIHGQFPSVEGLQRHVNGWIMDKWRFKNHMPARAARANPEPSKTYDIEQLELLAGRIERVKEGLFNGHLLARLLHPYAQLHETRPQDIEESERALHDLSRAAQEALESIKSKQIRKPFERDLILDLLIDYKQAFKKMPSAAHDDTTFMQFIGTLRDILTHRGHKLTVSRALVEDIIREEIAPL